MPIYEYKCKNCGYVTEYFFNKAEEKEIVCKNCGSRDLEKILSRVNISSSFSQKGKTCCGRNERCSTPPCSVGDICRRK
ncbi:MAG: FmdB family zinc ribbon protein [Thermodesulfovibrio sp.]